jgi:hypothetical protein
MVREPLLQQTLETGLAAPRLTTDNHGDKVPNLANEDVEFVDGEGLKRIGKRSHIYLC